MKYYITALFFFLSIGYVLAQEFSLPGSYRLDFQKTVESMDRDARNRYDSLPSEVRSRAETSMDAREFVFHPDGQLKVSWRSSSRIVQANGTWGLHGGSEVKLVLDVSGDIKEYDVVERSGHHLLLTNRKGNGLFNYLYLTKID